MQCLIYRQKVTLSIIGNFAVHYVFLFVCFLREAFTTCYRKYKLSYIAFSGKFTHIDLIYYYNSIFLGIQF